MGAFLRKKSVLVITCLIALVLIFGAVAYRNRKTVYVASDTSLKAGENSLLSKMAEIDSDNDGLKNWEESLWKTGANNPDSDGDGTVDGVEVRSNRDPRIKGPNDALEPDKGNTGLTPTEILAEETFTQYIKAQQSGQKLTEEEAGEIINELVRDRKNSISIKTYSEGNLALSNQEDGSSIREYGNKLGSIHKKNSPDVAEPEIYLLAKALEQKDEEIPIKLKNKANAYRATVEESLALPVPKSAAIIHLKMINALSREAAVVDMFALVYDDPVTALVGLGEYKITVTLVKDALMSFTQYFLQRGISFSGEEYGRFLLYPPN